MALSAFGRKGLQDSTHNMAAARPKLSVVPSGAERAWGTLDSLPSTSASFLDLRSSDAGRSVLRLNSAITKGKTTTGPQPNVKKMRRRVALLSGIRLNLPASPISGPSPPGSSREMAWTFTAEWDSTQDEIVFNEVEGGNSASTASSSPPSLRFMTSPVPFDVDEDEVFDLDVLSPPPPMTGNSPHFSDMGSSSSSSSAESSPSSPAVSDIFDFYTHTPSTLSFAHHDGDGFVSTPPSPVDPSSPRESAPPSYADSRHDPPIISVTFYQESSDPARGGTTLLSSSSAFDAYSFAYPEIPEKSPRLPTVPPPNRPAVARRPLPPVPVRSSSAETSVSHPGLTQRSSREDVRSQRGYSSL
ncbi:hypothetical protein BN946_scf184985.g24 [Trametes cinnabarina]|uniref:Uncharacterized protein n=1 Tax=Pycnoporus cinnabarinus TaxID=5643 RepID=A0A060SE08_PYCCI|nr:hypothetical protein BN946_scf184985.g24 [Trametes cinnabarina]